ncbi:MAG: hypothetical protein ACK4OM_06225 [Alphaproteobacteria bacterium]
MPCAQNTAYTTNLSFTGLGSSAWYGSLSASYGYLNYNTAMFSRNLDITKGSLNASNIFIDKKCSVNLGDEFLISGKIYLVDTEIFNDIYWTWTNDTMKNYIDEHHLNGIEYHNENYASHSNELLSLLGTQAD